MREEMLEYYERELTYLRQMGGEFARKYPEGCGDGFCSIRIAATIRMWIVFLKASRFSLPACIAGSMTIFPRSARLSPESSIRAIFVPRLR